MSTRDFLPEINRLSIVSAAIMLAFSLTQLVSFPVQPLSFELLGILIEFRIDFRTIITALTAILAAAGMDWLILSHPRRDPESNRWIYTRHWIIPVFTTIVISVALNTFTGSPFGWVTFVFGSLLLIAVLIAEYNMIVPDENDHPLARIGLTGLTFALFLMLSIALYSRNIRLYIRLPILAIGAMMSISRSLLLRTGNWHFYWALVNTLIVIQVGVGLHYLPLTPIQNGLILVGLAYAMTTLTTGITESRKGAAFWAEPVIMMTLMVIMSVFWR